MADRTLCVATTCAVSAECRRHADCPAQYAPNPHWQSMSQWEPEKGRWCYGYEPAEEARNAGR